MAKTNQEKVTNVAAVEVCLELTQQEEQERHRLELRIDRGIRSFYEVGAALLELRERRLYRDTHPNDFIGYCRDRFGKSKQAVNYLIAAAQIYENLTTTNRCREDSNNHSTTNRCRVLPTSEWQIRDLAGFDPEIQVEAWEEAVTLANGNIPSGRIVKSVVQRIRSKPLILASDYCKTGEVFFLQRLTGSEKKLNGCWAIAIEVENRFTVKAAVCSGAIDVKQENILQIDSEQTQNEIRATYFAIRKLCECELDPIDQAQIEVLCRRAWFTERQKQAIAAMQKVYKIEE